MLVVFDNQIVNLSHLIFKNKYAILICAVSFILILPAQAQSTITVVSRDDFNARYAISMIKLGLDKAEYDYRLNIIKEAYSEDKLETELLNGNIDIIWSATTKAYESTFIPVRVPLFKGLLGYRIFIVHRDNQDIFSGVKTLDDLRKFTLGQGRSWADTEILRANDLKVECGTYNGLFMMTDGKRFDGFPRGLHEPWSELESRTDLKLAVDENLLLSYKMPYYLFVSHKRSDLAAALERGLMMAIEDGSFDEKFYNEPFIKETFKRSNLKNRKIIELENPNLSSGTPIDDARLWLDIDKLH